MPPSGPHTSTPQLERELLLLLLSAGRHREGAGFPAPGQKYLDSPGSPLDWQDDRGRRAARVTPVMKSGQSAAGFTLLEVIVSMAILGLALMAIFDLNAGAVAMHAYTKKLTVASLLARSKMIDIEQDLYDKGFNNDDEEKSGDFSDEGWSSFKWRAKILAPRTQGVSPEQLIGAIFN